MSDPWLPSVAPPRRRRPRFGAAPDRALRRAVVILGALALLSVAVVARWLPSPGLEPASGLTATPTSSDDPSGGQTGPPSTPISTAPEPTARYAVPVDPIMARDWRIDLTISADEDAPLPVAFAFTVIA